MKSSINKNIFIALQIVNYAMKKHFVTTQIDKKSQSLLFKLKMRGLVILATVKLAYIESTDREVIGSTTTSFL